MKIPRFCILPKQLQQLNSVIDVNGDNKISQQEIDRAIKILAEANKKR